ncbi:activator of HSP90 ATPase [Defluviimonas sp. 20V17]|uniref:Activator of HSP90 ATPase n=1 Tax=Allgaiera indica TaxID=765699 RepID=A0AAN4UND5_9RHOB|nr:SRPBCC family protein [Allgaiera indica]KDB03013.1 activator of HSP90 ATPase [Defluviimonas sp. 20V17]GHD98637.1 activator of HSP90 ATPase [Allgaiera indica]SDW09469.1 Uncharacterized conserved protein YndB, AHSA1/START domain [Allgaiera indica]
MDLDPKTDLKLERSIHAPRALIWECWTRPEHIPQFFVPRPHRVTACEIDLRVGDRFNTTFEVDGKQIHNPGVYLEIIPGKKLVFTDGYSKDWRPSETPFMTAIVLLEDASPGVTSYTAIVRLPTPETRETHEDMGFFEGWGTMVTQLEDYAAGLGRWTRRQGGFLARGGPLPTRGRGDPARAIGRRAPFGGRDRSGPA